MQKKPQTQLMHLIRLGEGETLSPEAAKPLPQDVVPSFHVCRPAGFFARRRVLLRRDDQLVGLPEVAIAMTLTISDGDARPQLLATGFASVANKVGNYLAGGTT